MGKAGILFTGYPPLFYEELSDTASGGNWRIHQAADHLRSRFHHDPVCSTPLVLLQAAICHANANGDVAVRSTAGSSVDQDWTLS